MGPSLLCLGPPAMLAYHWYHQGRGGESLGRGVRQPWTRLPERACDNRHDTRQGGPELRCSGDLGLNPATCSTESGGT